jgi:hypothetical protein
MTYTITIAELRRADFVIRPGEAVAIAQKLINDPRQTLLQPPFGPPSIQNVVLDESGTVTCTACAVKPAVSEVAILLEAMLPPGTRLPGALRYTIARALLNVEAPPFDSVEELSAALARFERSDRDAVIRDLVHRARMLTGGGATAAIIPFKPSVPARFRPERRHALPAAVAAELRRDLRRADLERYARQAATTVPDLRRTLQRRNRPVGAVMAALGAGMVLIASGELMTFGPGEADMPMPVIAAPSPNLPDPASAQPPADVLSPAAIAPRRSPVRPVSVERGSRHRADGSRQPHTLQAARTRRADRRAPSNGVLARLRLGWVRNIFTYRPNL